MRWIPNAKIVMFVNLTILVADDKCWWMLYWLSQYEALKGCARYIFASLFFESKRKHL